MPIPRSANIKILLLFTAILIIISTLVYTQQIVKDLSKKEQEIAGLYARSLEFIVNASPDQEEFGFVFNEIIPAIDFPMILTDANHQPLQPYSNNSRNVDLDTSLPIEKQQKYLSDIVEQLGKENQPLKVTLHDTVVLNYVYYGESKIIKRLRWLPIVEIFVVGVFIFLGYFGFSYIKRTEQGNIWVGMAKETAHQLGTPLSSILGWIELIKSQQKDVSSQMEIIHELENDLNRLQKIVERFSKIGSKPILKEENLNEVISSVIDYFRRRLPSRFSPSSNIDISITASEQIKIPINRELFEWVIENLIKNALDAIEDQTGKITFSLHSKGNMVIIDVKDTGKGLDMRYRKDIFRPGYSTKQRGWGLGLSLSKRIIETYHKGKLFVKESKIGKGTTFRIKLRT